jgi:hypothetical protein
MYVLVVVDPGYAANRMNSAFLARYPYFAVFVRHLSSWATRDRPKPCMGPLGSITKNIVPLPRARLRRIRGPGLRRRAVSAGDGSAVRSHMGGSCLHP